MTSASVRPADATGSASPGPAATDEPTRATEGQEPDGRRWIAFGIMTVAIFMDMLDGTVVNVALPAIQADLGMTYGALQWTTAGYVLAFALLLITGGRLGDIYGRRRVFQFGVAGFTIASLVCGIATDPGTLIAARLLQGAMAGLMVPQVLAIVHVTFPDNEKGTVYAIQGTIGGVAATIAPLIGGVIVAADIFGWDWRPIFLINVPIGLVGFLLGMKYIPESRSSNPLRLDFVGVVLSTTALLLLLLPLTLGREFGWPAWCFAAMVASVFVFWGFIRYERAKQLRDGSPLVALDLFRQRSFSSALALTLASFTFMGMFMLALYLYLQMGLGWTPLRAGVTLLAFAIGAFVTASASVIVLVPKLGRAAVQLGSVVLVAGLLVFAWTNASIGAEATSWKLVPALFIIGMGFGASATPTALFGLQDVPQEDSGSASGLLNTMMQLGFAFGIALATLSFFTPLGSTEAHEGLGAAAYSDAFQWTIYAGIGVAVLGFIAASNLPRRLREQSHEHVPVG